VFLCVLIKLQATRNKPHAWPSGRDSPLIEMALVMCLQSKALGIHPSPPLWCLHVYSTSLPHGKAWKRKQQETSKASRCCCTWLNQTRMLSFGRDSRNSPPPETLAVGGCVGRRSPQSHLGSSQLLTMFEDAFISGVPHLVFPLFCWITLV